MVKHQSSLSKAATAIPPVQSFGFPHGAGSAAEAAYKSQQVANAEQTKLNNMHSGGKRLVVPQAPTHGVKSVGPNGANENATHGAKTLTQSVADGEFDLEVGKSPSQTGGVTRRRKKRVKKKSRRSYRKSSKRKSNKKRRQTRYRRKHKKRTRRR